jgi:hypothetical protein
MNEISHYRTGTEKAIRDHLTNEKESSNGMYRSLVQWRACNENRNEFL